MEQGMGWSLMDSQQILFPISEPAIIGWSRQNLTLSCHFIALGLKIVISPEPEFQT
jgi:hypothetical protein